LPFVLLIKITASKFVQIKLLVLISERERERVNDFEPIEYNHFSSSELRAAACQKKRVKKAKYIIKWINHRELVSSFSIIKYNNLFFFYLSSYLLSSISSHWNHMAYPELPNLRTNLNWPIGEIQSLNSLSNSIESYRIFFQRL